MSDQTKLAYEVIRIIDSIPLFWEDHFLRMSDTVKSISDKQIDFESFKKVLKELITKQNLVNGNIKITYNTAENTDVFNAFIIPHKYPSQDEYTYGVETITLKYEREEPNNKIWNNSLREKVDALIKENKVYEVLYLDRNNCLTEGSRSNLFFIDKNTLFSAPEDKILHGITRKYVIQTALELGISLQIKNLLYDEIQNYNSAFISGTSPKILPIRKIDNIYFNVENKILRDLMSHFDEYIESYIRNTNF